MTNLYTSANLNAARITARTFSGSFAEFNRTQSGETILQACAAAYLAIINKRERLGQINPATATRERANIAAAVSTVWTIAAEACKAGKDYDKTSGLQLCAWLTLYRAANAAACRLYREDVKQANALKLDTIQQEDGTEAVIERVNLHTRRGIGHIEQPTEALLKVDLQQIARSPRRSCCNVEARETFARVLLLTNNRAEATRISGINPRAARTLCEEISEYIKK